MTNLDATTKLLYQRSTIKAWIEEIEDWLERRWKKDLIANNEREYEERAKADSGQQFENPEGL
jgi:hypothetical protein